ncbi:hypothetical protein [Haloparvum sp. PAK95]|uniref:hypothetical protein n=1 Tax=Haloparvum sp. PAK95 TaxID=3418962 RepID=UPI003D2F1DCD
MVTLLELVLTVATVLFAIVGVAGVIGLSNNYEGVMDTRDKAVAGLGVVFIALMSYGVLF